MSNFIETYLKQHWNRLKLNRFGSPEPLQSDIIIPSFDTSSHLIFLISNGTPSPVLVAKLSREKQSDFNLTEEYKNLQFLQSLESDIAKAIPVPVTLDSPEGHPLLLETAVPGKILRPWLLRKNFTVVTSRTITWLQRLHRQSLVRSNLRSLVENMQEAFIRNIPQIQKQDQFVKTAKAGRIIGDNMTMSVTEHGDFGSPNLLFTSNGEIGIIDWELGRRQGFPLLDLIFFLAFALFSREKARTGSEQRASFLKHFFQPNSWGLTRIHHYVRELNLDPDWVPSLFLLCWFQAMLNQLLRWPAQPPAERYTRLIRNRYYALWETTAGNFLEFRQSWRKTWMQ